MSKTLNTTPRWEDKKVVPLSFWEKYNLQGHPIKICAKTAAEIVALLRRCDYITKSSADWAKNCNQRFGQN